MFLIYFVFGLALIWDELPQPVALLPRVLVLRARNALDVIVLIGTRFKTVLVLAV